jgi:hypothetical protein
MIEYVNWNNFATQKHHGAIGDLLSGELDSAIEKKKKGH